jgi:glycosyltransferase involved in cell wall biosynthesis
VLYVIQHRDFSGAETSQAALIEADRDALVACPAGSPAEGFVRGLGAATVDLPFKPLRHSGGLLELLRSVPRGLASAWRLRRILRNHPEQATLYATSIRPALLASLASLGLPRTLIWCVPDLLPPWPLRPLVRLLARLRADRVLCLSEYIARDLVGGRRSLARVTEVVNPGVDLDRFGPATASPGTPSAAIVGHISEVKRTDVAVEVAALVARQAPEFRLRIVGSAQFRDEDFELERRLKSRVAGDPALADRVEFTGRTPSVEAALADCGILLHCRPDEPFGMVLVEAMALGLPVVAPAAGGPLEIVVDDVTGLLYEPIDPQSAAECVLRLLGDPELAARLGSAGRMRAEEIFSAERQLDLSHGLIAKAEAAG